ncbi:MAG: aspartate aminotransferase family protein [Ruminococcaceae bacterium]|nr:aspartate aminotransferase family protein [Oscillospiraceae bacterium]
MDKNYWAHVDLNTVPSIKTPLPGPRSTEMHNRAAKIMKGYSSQVRLFPVSFESGFGCVLTDVDGNRYIDFSSGIYVTGLGHCHPKISEAVANQAKKLMNCHDFTTEIKMKLLEKLAATTMGDLNGVQLYDSGTTAVEAALRCARAATGGKFEFMSFWRDFHGKTMGAVSCAGVDSTQGMRAPGFFLAPRPNCYRCPFRMKHPECGCYCADFLEQKIKQETTGRLAGIILEPVQGWGGSVVPPPEFMGRVRALCDKLGCLMIADEVLTCMGRTGKMFAMEHWNVTPDITTLGKGFGNGFPVTAMCVSDKYKESIEQISASSSYGGNPMACAAALASIEVIEEEHLCERSAHLGELMLARMRKMKEAHPIIGDVRGLGCLLAIELVKDRETKEEFPEAGKMVYQKAFSKGLAWVPSGHILRLSPQLIMEDEVALRGMDIIEEAVAETERELGY